MPSARRLASFALASLLLLALAACQRQEPPLPAPKSAVGATVRVSGAWALYPMMVRWAEEYKKIRPDVVVDVTAGGTGKAVSDVLAGLVDIGMISRDIRQNEIDRGGQALAVARDAVFPTINAANPVLDRGLAERGISRETFAELFLKQKTLTWGELAGVAHAEKVNVYRRSDGHGGAGENWARYLGGDSIEDLHGIAVYGDPAVAEAVRRDPLGLGFNNLAVVFDMTTGRVAAGLAIAPMDLDGDGRVASDERITTSAEAARVVGAGTYPSPPARDLYVFGKGAWQGPSKAFVDWIVTDGQRFLDQVGYLPPAGDL